MPHKLLAITLCGHASTHLRIYASIGIGLGDTLSKYLKDKDKDKTARHDVRKLVKYKTSRKIGWTNKYKQLREKQMYDNKNGLGYETGMSMALARSRLKEKNVERNPEGAAKKKLRCPYHHPKWCTVLGHNSRRSDTCMMKGKPPEILKAAKYEIQKDLVLE